ncbi:MAG TPA: hypothetical protein VGI88_00515 [Verrucomicrobiae bacterium]|jgi:hypothetical protein
MTQKSVTIIGGFVLSMALLLLAALGTACNKSSSVVSEKTKKQRLAWNLKTTVEAYNHAGFSNFAWDNQARRCLTGFAQILSQETNAGESVVDVISTNAATAVNAGCTDPLVNYLYIKFSMPQSSSKEAFETAFCKTARDLNSSSYPPIRKFYAAARALQQIYHTYGTNASTHPELMEMLWNVYGRMEDALRDDTMPARDAYEAAALALHMTSGNTFNHAKMYDIVEKPLFKNWPNADTTWLLKGHYYIDAAWDARGSGSGDTVTAEGWAGFTNDLAIARDALEHAWKLNPKESEIADEMLSVALGQGDRDQMELWFNRAMEANTNDYTACSKKLYYLEPKWYGSDAEELAFGRECVQNTKWGGQVPLTLVDAHISIDSRNEGQAQMDYWKQPEVWADIQAAYDRYFELNPDDIGYYHNYVWYAYQAEQWAKLNELIPKLGPVNYNYFGGKEAFDQMVEAANAHK